MKIKTGSNTKKKNICSDEEGNEWELREGVCVKNRYNSDEEVFDSVYVLKGVGRVFWESFTESAMVTYVRLQ